MVSYKILLKLEKEDREYEEKILLSKIEDLEKLLKESNKTNIENSGYKCPNCNNELLITEYSEIYCSNKLCSFDKTVGDYTDIQSYLNNFSIDENIQKEAYGYMITDYSELFEQNKEEYIDYILHKNSNIDHFDEIDNMFYFCFNSNELREKINQQTYDFFEEKINNSK